MATLKMQTAKTISINMLKLPLQEYSKGQSGFLSFKILDHMQSGNAGLINITSKCDINFKIITDNNNYEYNNTSPDKSENINRNSWSNKIFARGNQRILFDAYEYNADNDNWQWQKITDHAGNSKNCGAGTMVKFEAKRPAVFCSGTKTESSFIARLPTNYC